jgi:hypothetical protein
MMTPLEWFAICLPLGGLVAAGLYAYVLNRNADRLNATIPVTPTGTDAKAPRRRYNLNTELKLETAVKRANQAASSAEAAAAKAELSDRVRRSYQVRDPATKFPTLLRVSSGVPVSGEWAMGGSIAIEQMAEGRILGVTSPRSAGSEYEAAPTPQ